MNQLLTAAVLALLVVGSSALIGKDQSVGVKGKLTCNGKPASGVLVKLWDDDSGIDTDDLLGKTKTDSDGHFETHGYTDEILNIDPNPFYKPLLFPRFSFHDCHDEPKPCQRKITTTIPDSYISNGKTPEKYYDAGTIELSGGPKGESRDCIH
ncbi:Transthyretin-like protein 5 [Aphelenchoides fujianensis]|nr:Transthyretin-like protein 5 [Aphelenchoides fujianensis]